MPVHEMTVCNFMDCRGVKKYTFGDIIDPLAQMAIYWAIDEIKLRKKEVMPKGVFRTEVSIVIGKRDMSGEITITRQMHNYNHPSFFYIDRIGCRLSDIRKTVEFTLL
jgi:hypothetical protein